MLIRFCSFVFALGSVKTCRFEGNQEGSFTAGEAEAAGTSIAVCLVDRASGENRYRKGIAMAITMLLISAANILLAPFIYVIVLWIWQD